MQSKIIVIDRNIMSVIKNANLKKKTSNNDELKILKTLRNNDRKLTTITPMLSILEGQKGYPETLEEMEATIQDEAQPLKTFFRKAKVDSNYLLNNSKYLASIFVDFEKNHNTKYDHFLT